MFYTYAETAFNTFKPDEEIPDNSVFINKIYEDKKSFSCQIKFKENNVIAKCNYYKESGKTFIEFFEMTHYMTIYEIDKNIYDGFVPFVDKDINPERLDTLLLTETKGGYDDSN